MDDNIGQAFRSVGIPIGSALVLLLSASGPVWAQYSVPAEAARIYDPNENRGTVMEVARAPEKVSVPWELGGSFNFITSDANPAFGGQPLKFTDVLLLRTHAAVTLGKRIQIFGGSDLLTKQPSTVDEPIWQGGLFGTRVLIDDAFSAWVRGEGGQMLGNRGWWLTSDAAARYRVAMVDSFYFESALGAAYTRLFPDADGAPAMWFMEVLADVGLALREPDGKAALWLSFDFAFPVVADPDRDSPDPATGAFIDPQTRVSVRMGGRVAVNETVDLFLQWSIFDRGDLIDPATTLPILNRGFDQQQLVIGFILRFGQPR